jgi:hypothetical protein
MRQQLITLGLALAALVLCYALLVPKPSPEMISAARPLSSDEGPAGYQAAWRWLSAESVSVAALNERFDSLSTARNSPHPHGNVLLTTLPHVLPVRPGEATALDAWVESGNTLIVAAALDDTPSWAIADASTLLKELSRLTRLKFSVIDDPTASKAQRLSAAFEALTGTRDVFIEPRGTLPLMQGVHGLQVVSDLPAARWKADAMDAATILQIGQVMGLGDPAIWVRQQGKGQVITLGVAGLFSNRDIGLKDNARFLSNLVAWNLSPGSRFIFDDVHQGAAKYYDAKAFFADARLHRTIGWLILLWFVFVLGVQRLGVPLVHWRPPDITAFVATSGEFLASTVSPKTTGARLLANFFNSIRRRLGLAEDGQPLWEWLSSQATLQSADVELLRQMHSRLGAGRHIDLSRLHNLIVKLQGKIL